MLVKNLSIAAIPAALLLTAAPVAATEIFDNTPNSCTTDDCSSLLLPMTVTNPGGNGHPSVVEVYGRAGECVRLRVVAQSADLEVTAVATDGTTFRNDDSGLAPCPLCSLVKFIAPDTGWHTVQTSHFAGNAVYSDYRLLYGRYTGAGNPNCANPTTPTAASAAASAKASGGSVPVGAGGTAN